MPVQVTGQDGDGRPDFHRQAGKACPAAGPGGPMTLISYLGTGASSPASGPHRTMFALVGRTGITRHV